MNAPRTEPKEKALKVVVEWYLSRPWEQTKLSQASLESLAELLLTTWKQACQAQNESTRAAATHAEKFHKTKTPRPVYTLGTRPPFSIETLPNEEK